MGDHDMAGLTGFDEDQIDRHRVVLDDSRRNLNHEQRDNQSTIQKLREMEIQLDQLVMMQNELRVAIDLIAKSSNLVAVAEQDETAELSPSGSSSSKNNTETQVQIEQSIAKENMTLQESSPRQQRIQHNISLSPQLLASNIDTDSVGVSSLPVHEEDDYDDNNEMSA
jgi:hypothetical protein